MVVKKWGYACIKVVIFINQRWSTGPLLNNVRTKKDKVINDPVYQSLKQQSKKGMRRKYLELFSKN